MLKLTGFEPETHGWHQPTICVPQANGLQITLYFLATTLLSNKMYKKWLGPWTSIGVSFMYHLPSKQPNWVTCLLTLVSQWQSQSWAGN